MNPYYRDYSDYLLEKFARKVQKISINPGFPCPNRTGQSGTGGCHYCNNRAFSPAYTLQSPGDVEKQLKEGIKFFGRKYPNLKYLAYFQSHTPTNGTSHELMAQVEKAASVPGIVGIIIATRPDCVFPELLNNLATLNRRIPVMLEIGAESMHNTTLQRVNRCHSVECAVDAILRASRAGLDVGVHLIMGLPGETQEMMLESVKTINRLPVSSVKFHQLQIVRDTQLASQYALGVSDIRLFTLEEYLELCVTLIDTLRPDIAIDRFVSAAPASLLVAPRWGIKNHEFTDKLHRILAGRRLRPKN